MLRKLKAFWKIYFNVSTKLYSHHQEMKMTIVHDYRPFALTSQILILSSRCSLTISVRVQKPHTAQELAILIQNYYKLLKNLLCLQKLYYAQIANLSSRCIVTGDVTSCARGLQFSRNVEINFSKCFQFSEHLLFCILSKWYM